MKTDYTRAINCILSFMLACSACSKNDPGSRSNSSSEIRIVATHDNTENYSLGKPFNVTISIDEQHAQEEYFFIKISHIQGNAIITLDGECVHLGEWVQTPYSVNNEVSSTQTLVYTITPDASSAVDQTIRLSFIASSADGKAKSEDTITVSALNPSPINVDVDYSGEAIESSEKLSIDFNIQKKGFTGYFNMSFRHMEGEGYCEYEKIFHDDINIAISADLGNFTCKYQPLKVGKHHLVFTITDGVYTQEVEVKCEVYNNDALVYPDKDGVYIFVKDYQGKAFVSRKDYDSDSDLEVEGIAYFSYNMRILLPLHSSEPLLFCGPNDNLTKIPGVDATSIGDGKINTQKIYNAYKSGVISSAPIVDACYNFDPAHPGRWYLPSPSQLKAISFQVSMDEIRSCMRLVGGTLFLTRESFATASVNAYNYVLLYDSMPFIYQNLEYGRLLTANAAANPISYFPIRDL